MTYILPYTSGAYRSFYSDEHVSSFTHGTLAKGECDLDQAKQMVKCLNERKGVSTISFNPEMLTQKQLDGGACTAIILRLAKEILPMMKENQNLSPQNRDKVFLKNFQHLIKDLEETATGSKVLEKATQKAIRTEQLALNTITVDREKPHIDHAVSEKISAMAPYYGLKVVNSSSEIQVKGNPQLQEDLVSSFATLKDGAYFLRIIQKENNHKLEKQGHSILYIKTNGSEYYFDPALGGYELLQGVAKTNLVYNAALSANEQYGVDNMTIHQLEEEVPLISERFALLELGVSGVIYSTSPKSPVIIFSPALGKGIESYKLMALELVKRGFTVMCVDHLKTALGTPHLKESEIIKRGLENGESIRKLTDKTFKSISPNSPIFVMGHSLGGSSSIEACRDASKIRAVINLDGRIIDPNSISKPILQIIATDVREDRSAYNIALKSLAEKNSELVQKEMKVKHEDFSSQDRKFIENVADECAHFFNQFLTGS